MALEYLQELQGKIDIPLLLHEREQREGRRGVNEERYRRLLHQLPSVSCTTEIRHGRIHIAGKLAPGQREEIVHRAQQLKNWKKGPFDLFGTAIDSEWRSDLKWERIRERVGPLRDQVVLDIGCNNGYFMYRMREAGAKLVLGIDPIWHLKAQFEFIQHFSQTPGLHFELFGIEHLPAFQDVFDTIFSMGILYHHPHPLQQLQHIFQALRPGGRIVLETIGIPGEEETALCPRGRYAQMKNVWFLPTLPTLLHWMKKSRFQQLEVISTEWEGVREQRSTEWCAPVSYRDFLHPDNPQLTIEGYPAPLRFAVKGSK